MPFLIIWMAKGMDELSLWSKETLISSLGGESRGSYVQSLIAAVLLLAALVAGAKATRGMEALRVARAESLYLKEAGLALRDRAQGKTVMDSGTIVAFYSGATWLPSPVGSVAGQTRFSVWDQSGGASEDAQQRVREGRIDQAPTSAHK
jgi:hypothetical protein